MHIVLSFKVKHLDFKEQIYKIVFKSIIWYSEVDKSVTLTTTQRTDVAACTNSIDQRVL